MDAVDLAMLVKLKGSGLALAEGEQDLRGRKVFDPRGEEVGEVKSLMVDDLEKKVRFLRVAAGGILGMRARKFLVPVEAVVRFDAAGVHIDRTRQDVVTEPAYDPDLVELDVESMKQLCRHFNYPPYWERGRHQYPTYPFNV